MTTLTRTLTTFDRFGTWSADLPLRLFLAWEFFESGWEKFNGSNWFADLQANFPFPFNLLPAELNWQLSMWAELILPLLLLLGLGTRLASFGLMVVTVAMRKPAMSTGKASGSRTLRNACSLVMPTPDAASMVIRSTPVSPAEMLRTRASWA